MTDRDLLELITEKIMNMDERMECMDKRMDRIESKLDQKTDKTDIVRLENELVPQIKALFDGQKQHSEQLQHIEEKISTHDEFILKRIK